MGPESRRDLGIWVEGGVCSRRFNSLSFPGPQLRTAVPSSGHWGKESGGKLGKGWLAPTPGSLPGILLRRPKGKKPLGDYFLASPMLSGPGLPFFGPRIPPRPPTWPPHTLIWGHARGSPRSIRKHPRRYPR